MSVSFLKHYYSFSVTFSVILRSISGTGKVDIVIIFNTWEWNIQKLSSVDLNKSTEATSNYSIRQVVPNINNSISERKFPKIIMISIF